MNKTIKSIALAAMLSATWTAAAGAAPRGGDAIPFIGFGGIQNWTARDDSTLYVQSAGGQWYQVNLAQPCLGLPFALRIGVDSGPTNTLDDFSTIIADGDRCPVASVTRLDSSPPSVPAAKPKN